MRFALILYMARAMREESLGEMMDIMQGIDQDRIHSDYVQGRPAGKDEDPCCGTVAGKAAVLCTHCHGMAACHRSCPLAGDHPLTPLGRQPSGRCPQTVRQKSPRIVPYQEHFPVLTG